MCWVNATGYSCGLTIHVNFTSMLKQLSATVCQIEATKFHYYVIAQKKN